MNISSPIKKNQGVGIIEVIITTLVVAFGLLAVASLQGDLMSGSGRNKARSEARLHAEEKIEELSNLLEQSDYTTIASSTTADSITGSNAQFNRSWVINNLTAPDRKQISVTVSWGQGNDDSVTLTSIITYNNPILSALGASSTLGGGAGNAPSPNVNSSEEINDEEEKNISDLTSTSNPDIYTDSDGNWYKRDSPSDTTGTLVFDVSNLNAFENGLYTTRNSTTGSIVLYKGNGDGVGGADISATRVFEFFGDIIITIKGTVYTANNLDNTANFLNQIDVQGSDASYCVFDGGVDQSSAPYVCYVGGNCKYGPNGNNTNVKQCSNPAVNNTIVGVGGWRGKIGLIRVDDEGGSVESVCFEEELTWTAGDLVPSTAREYFTQRTNNSTVTREGINASYACHDFLVVERVNNNNSLLHDKCVTGRNQFPRASVPGKQIIRALTGTTANAVVAEDTSSCVTGYSISFTSATNNYIVSSATCDDGSGASLCTGLQAGTYTSNVTLSGTNTYTCSGSYTITNSDIAVEVTKGSGQSTTCNLSP